jgi:hypothetical protein
MAFSKPNLKLEVIIHHKLILDCFLILFDRSDRILVYGSVILK